MRKGCEDTPKGCVRLRKKKTRLSEKDPQIDAMRRELSEKDAAHMIQMERMTQGNNAAMER